MSALSRLVEELPVRAFAGPGAEDPGVLLPSLFGSGVVVVRTVACGGTGAWLDGWVALVPGPDGVCGIMIPGESLDWSWERSSRGGRIDAVVDAVADLLVPAQPDAAGVAVACVESIARSWSVQDWSVEALIRAPRGQVSANLQGWLLQAVLSSVGQEDAAGMQTLLALACPPQAVEVARVMVEALGHLAENWGEEEAAEALLQRVAAVAGEPWSPVDLEERNLVEPLLCRARAQWPQYARALVAASLAWQPWSSRGSVTRREGWSAASS